MTINLTTGSPTVTTTGLTAGAAHSIQHIGGIIAAVQVGAGAAWLDIYAADVSGGAYIPALCGTSIRWTLKGAAAAADITLTQAQ